MTATTLQDLASMTFAHLSVIVLLVKATIILVAALGITIAMQRASAGARHLVWLVALGTLLVMPALTAWGPLPLRVLPAESPPTVVAHQQTTPPAVDASSPAVVPNTVDASTPTVVPNTSDAASAESAAFPAPSRYSLRDMSWLAIALTIWGAVLFAIGCSLVWSALLVRRIVRRARALEGAEWMTPLWEVSDRFGLEEAPRLLRSEDAKMPFACGVLTPTIVLPAECDAWSPDRRRAVLLHELAHVRRHDLLGHTLGRLVCAVYWFHPLVWTAAKQLRSESERACDDLALSCGTRATDYAEHLLDIVTSVRRDATPSVALAMARRKEFEGRMLAILDPQLRRVEPSRRQSASLIVTLAMISIVVGAAAPAPRLATAAMVATSARQAQAPIALPAQPESNAQPSFERDSRIHGVQQHTSTSMATSTVTSKQTVMHEVQSAYTTFGDGALAGANAGVKAGVAAGVTAAVSAGVDASVKSLASVSANELRTLMQRGRAGQDPRTDDRPILLAKVLRSDTSATLRRVAAWGLSEYASVPVAAEALANAVRHDANASVREMAAWSLGEANDGVASALDALTAAMRGDADTKVRATAAWSLGNMGDRAATDALVAALADASPEVRMRALWAIGNVEPKEAPHAVLSLLADKDARVRELAAWTLYQIEDPSAAPALDAALRAESNKDLQLAYIRALAALGEKSVDAIRGLLESNDPRIRTMAVKALAGGHAAGPWPWPWPEPRPYP